METPHSYSQQLTVNGHAIKTILVGRHYLKMHPYMNDTLILDLVMALDGANLPVDSITAKIEYFAADVRHEASRKIYCLIWLFEGDKLEIIGVIHAYRRRKSKKGPQS